MSKHYALAAAGIVQALRPQLLPSFEEFIGPAVAKEVRIALRERQDRLEKAGDYEAQTRSINASTALGFERYTDGDFE